MLHAFKYIKSFFFLILGWGVLLWLSSPLLASMLEGRLSAKSKSFVVVIDAGHGGHDGGTCGNGLKEKDITLDIALKVGERIKSQYPRVKVLYTRSTDVFVKLHDRATFANRNKADLFISIHVNSAPNKGVYGTETYVLGSDKSEDKHAAVNETNLRVVMRENQAITLEKDYQQTYHGFDPSSTESYIAFSMIKNKHYDQSVELGTYIQEAYRQAGRKSDRGVRPGDLLVVRNVAMPSVLTEVGFITNTAEAHYMGTESGRSQLAGAIVRGFAKYYKRLTGGSSVVRVEESSEREPVDAEVVPEAEISQQVASADSSKEEPQRTTPPEKELVPTHSSTGTTYSVQLISAKSHVKTTDPQFKGYAVRCEKVGDRYAYVYGTVDNMSKARDLRKKVRKHFKDAFIVRYKDGRRVEAIY